MTSDALAGLVIILFICFNVYLAKKKGRSIGWTLLGSIFLFPVVTIYLLIRNKSVGLAEAEERERYRNTPEGKAAAIRAAEDAAQKKLHEDLEDISGVSDKIAGRILDQYSTSESIKSATEEELIEIPGVGKGLAKAIKARIG